jgi:hypothetical protein
MSEKMFKFLLDELKVIRIICKNCKTCFEFPLDNLDKAFYAATYKNWACPHCLNPVMGDSTGAPTGGPFNQFLRAVKALKDVHNAVDVQFIVKEE